MIGNKYLNMYMNADIMWMNNFITFVWWSKKYLWSEAWSNGVTMVKFRKNFSVIHDVKLDISKRPFNKSWMAKNFHHAYLCVLSRRVTLVPHRHWMSVEEYARHYPILAQLQNPSGTVELVETIGKGNYGYVYKVISPIVDNWDKRYKKIELK